MSADYIYRLLVPGASDHQQSSIRNTGSLEPVETPTGSSTPAPYSGAGAFTSQWNSSEINVNCRFLAVKPARLSTGSQNEQ